jgi:hypothetical protein
MKPASHIRVIRGMMAVPLQATLATGVVKRERQIEL